MNPPGTPVRSSSCAQHQQLSDAEGVAALDAVDHEAVGPVLADVVGDQVDARGQPQVGVAAHAVLGQGLERPLGVVAEAAVVEPADLGVARRHHHRALVGEHLPELAEARPVGRPFHHQPVALRPQLAVGRDRAAALRQPLFDLRAQGPVVLDALRRAAEGGEHRPDVVDAAEVGIDRRGHVLGALQHPDEIVLGLGRQRQALAQPVLVVAPAGHLLELGDHLGLELLDDVVAMMVEDPAVRLIGHVQHRHRAVVLLRAAARTTS